MEKNDAQDLVVFEGVQVTYFDPSFSSDKAPGSVIFHLANDERKTQMSLYLKINGDEVTVIDEDRIQEYIHGKMAD